MHARAAAARRACAASGAAAAADGRRRARPSPKTAGRRAMARSCSCCSARTWAPPRSLARAIADAGEAQGFATTLARLDDHAGKLPAEGAVAIVCASYNGGAAGQRRRLHQEPGERCRRIAEGRALHRVRLRQPRLGLDLPGDPAPDRRAAGRQGRRADLCPRRGRRRGGSRRPLPGLERAVAAGAGRQARREARARCRRRARAALPGAGGRQAAGQSASSAARARCRCACSSTASCRMPPTLGPQHAAYRGAAARRRQLPRRRPSQHRAAERRGAGRAGAAALRLRARRARHAGGGRGPARHLPVGEAIAVHRLLSDFVELQLPATRKQIQTMAQHTRCPVHAAQARALLDEEASARRSWPSASPCSTSWSSYPACELPFAAFLEMLPLMTPRYYSISSSPMADGTRCSITVAVVEGAGALGRRRLSRRLLESSAAPGRRRHRAGFRPRRPRWASACRSIRRRRSS